MNHKIAVKICGVTRSEDVRACQIAGARYIGLNFFPKSPRYVSPVTARELSLATPEGVAKVALTVNADDAKLEEILDRVPIDILQLHGSESPDRVADVRHRFGLPVMRAVGVAGAEDLPVLESHAQVADMLLVDAKPPKDAILPGGNGIAFDWRLIADRRWTLPWMLAGGLTPENVAEAVRLTGATSVDVSSGVEAAPGVKDPQKIAAFVQAAQPS